jgi:hypothetical protein
MGRCRGLFPYQPCEKAAGGALLKTAFAKSISLGLEGAGSGVDYSENVRQGRILPVRFFRMKESLEEFSALPVKSRIGEF